MFGDEDFDDFAHIQKEKKMTLKDQIRKDALKKIKSGVIEGSDSEEGGMFRKKGVPMAEEQSKLKNAFKEAAEESDEFMM